MVSFRRFIMILFINSDSFLTSAKYFSDLSIAKINIVLLIWARAQKKEAMRQSKYNKMRKCCYFLLIFVIFGCSKDEFADTIIKNAKVYTVESAEKNISSVAIKDGRIIEISATDLSEKLADKTTKIIDANGQFLMPGFIEGHGHFSGLGRSLQELNLLKTKSWDEIVSLVEERVKKAKPGEWITGRGWHQEKWHAYPGETYYGYPDHKKLSEISPDNPVMLIHASGHGLFANAKAMQLARINIETLDPKGGAIIRDGKGEPIGVFEENAMSMIRGLYQDELNSKDPEELHEKWEESIDLAMEECLKKGITSFQDAGSSFKEIHDYTEMAKNGELRLRLWAMIRRSSEEMQGKLAGIKTINAGNGFFTCRAIKTEIDGALGSYGAWLLEEYADKKDFKGQNTTSLEEVNKIAALAKKNDMQLCIHAIGDRGNREILDMIENNYSDQKEGRWRMEHSQHLHPDDIPRFKELGVIASMQAIHCTSDSPFVVARLGEKRAREGAYPWRSLLDAGVVVTNGTDAPVEDVDPLLSMYASVSRKRPDFIEPFFPEQAMTREEAIESYTLTNAYAAFEENEKGSIKVGKYADLVLLDTDLYNCEAEKILDTKVLWTMVDGKIEYQAE